MQALTPRDSGFVVLFYAEKFLENPSGFQAHVSSLTLSSDELESMRAQVCL
jgi:hypothetical protein